MGGWFEGSWGGWLLVGYVVMGWMGRWMGGTVGVVGRVGSGVGGVLVRVGWVVVGRVGGWWVIL